MNCDRVRSALVPIRIHENSPFFLCPRQLSQRGTVPKWARAIPSEPFPARLSWYPLSLQINYRVKIPEKGRCAQQWGSRIIKEGAQEENIQIPRLHSPFNRTFFQKEKSSLEKSSPTLMTQISQLWEFLLISTNLTNVMIIIYPTYAG